MLLEIYNFYTPFDQKRFMNTFMVSFHPSPLTMRAAINNLCPILID